MKYNGAKRGKTVSETEVHVLVSEIEYNQKVIFVSLSCGLTGKKHSYKERTIRTTKDALAMAKYT
jgi:hypothetical protein